MFDMVGGVQSYLERVVSMAANLLQPGLSVCLTFSLGLASEEFFLFCQVKKWIESTAIASIMDRLIIAGQLHTTPRVY